MPQSVGTIQRASFGKMPDGTPVEIYTLRNSQGMEARILNYGGIVQSLFVPDRHGKFSDVVLGHDDLQGYLTKSPYFGSVIGRYGNRIGGAKFVLGGKNYTLAANNGLNSLHGGRVGFDKIVWAAQPLKTPEGVALRLTYLSKDGEEGFPGNLKVTVTYTLSINNELKQECHATTDQTTVVNLTHHSYFNLVGHERGDILGHIVQINADQTTPVDSALIPTGEFADVSGTPFDFRTPMAIGARINDLDPILQYGPGYDHNWVINKPPGELGFHARVVEPVTGRVMEVWSDEPGVQFYAGNSLNDIHGKGGAVYRRRSAFCFEPQHHPDSPNKPHFPTTELKPGETFKNAIIYKFFAA